MEMGRWSWKSPVNGDWMWTKPNLFSGVFSDEDRGSQALGNAR